MRNTFCPRAILVFLHITLTVLHGNVALRKAYPLNKIMKFEQNYEVGSMGFKSTNFKKI